MIRSFGGKSPKIHPTAFVSEAAYVVGDVEIGAGSSIWPGTVVRANEHKIVIAENVNIQDNSLVHNEHDSYIGPNVTIGHMVLCHADYVGEGTLIGNGAVVNGEALIGDHCVIASAAVILERAIIPPGSIVLGTPPNQVVRPGTDRHRGLGEDYAGRYFKNSRLFKANGLEDPDSAKFAYDGPIPSEPYDHPTFATPATSD